MQLDTDRLEMTAGSAGRTAQHFYAKVAECRCRRYLKVYTARYVPQKNYRPMSALSSEESL
jgi:hypothetical protein